MSYKEPGRYSTKGKDANTKMTEMLELVSQEFKGVIIKMLQGAIMDTFETNRKSQKINEIDKKEANWNFRIEKYKSKNKIAIDGQSPEWAG